MIIFVAQDVREILAELGFSSLSEIIGRTDLLKQVKGNTDKHKKLNLKKLLISVKNGSSKYIFIANSIFIDTNLFFLLC